MGPKFKCNPLALPDPIPLSKFNVNFSRCFLPEKIKKFYKILFIKIDRQFVKIVFIFLLDNNFLTAMNDLNINFI